MEKCKDSASLTEGKQKFSVFYVMNMVALQSEEMFKTQCAYRYNVARSLSMHSVRGDSTHIKY